jgi:hypothetical protein
MGTPGVPVSLCVLAEAPSGAPTSGATGATSDQPRRRRSGATRRTRSIAHRRPVLGLRGLFLGLVTVGFSLGGPGSSAASEPAPTPGGERLEAIPFARSPVIDGDLADWPGGEVRQIALLNRREQAPPLYRDAWRGPTDASAKIRVGCDGESLFLAIEVTDDKAVHPGEPWWHGDSVELFLNTGFVPGESPPQAYTDSCWQIFLMPLNPLLAWGVAYHGPRVVFDDGGLKGSRLAYRRKTGGAYDLEFSLPLARVGLSGDHRREIGFAVALTDADEEPGRQKTYLSWNSGFDLFQRPDRFGVLTLPAPSAPLGRPDGGGQVSNVVPMVLAALLALGLALALAGPGARRLSRVGPRPKFVALALTGTLALFLDQRGEQQAHGPLAAIETQIAHAAAEIDAVAREAHALGALDDPDPAERSRRLTRLIQGERLPCTPPLDELALVPLLEPGAAPSRAAPGYAIPLERAQRFHLLHPLAAASLTVRTSLEAREERRDAPRPLGTLRLTGADGARPVYVIQAAASGSADGAATSRLALPSGGPWTHFDWTPLPHAPRALLLGIEASDALGAWRRCRSRDRARTASRSSPTRMGRSSRARSSRARSPRSRCRPSPRPTGSGSC